MKESPSGYARRIAFIAEGALRTVRCRLSLRSAKNYDYRIHTDAQH